MTAVASELKMMTMAMTMKGSGRVGLSDPRDEFSLQ
jgi:hypothetical protein